MDPFTKQGNCPRTLIRKSPYTKAGHFLGSQCPEFDIRGNLFGAILPGPFIIQQGCVFNLSLDNRGPFQDNNACFNSTLDTMELVFQQCMSLYSTIQCLQPVHGQQDTFAEQKMHPSTQQNSGLKLSMNILRTLTGNTGFHTTRRSLRPLVGVPYSFREQYREKSIVFTPPPPPHLDFVFQQSSTRHVSLDYKAMLQTCQWTS
ncbi:hypothetical protein TNCT_380011 [Trichonephila clavata]|uniref:Uncharacterized protein n=1 Tax=Trichonephila clavata TaxID=2740835 RepID=A0A8X6FF82_TRICU|nr:hypothetical protein TNCT_380011 [Trichonephila clavata]